MIKKIMKRMIFLAAVLLLLPTVVSAQGTLGGLITEVQGLVDSLIPLILAIATVGVLWGLARYAFKAGDEKAQEEGRRVMVWGIITLFVMFSIWGIVAILQTAFGTGGIVSPQGGIPTLSDVPGSTDGGGGGVACNTEQECRAAGYNYCDASNFCQ